MSKRYWLALAIFAIGFLIAMLYHSGRCYHSVFYDCMCLACWDCPCDCGSVRLFTKCVIFSGCRVLLFSVVLATSVIFFARYKRFIDSKSDKIYLRGKKEKYGKK
jgi:hypothetical protein